jgi:hypothetical protein
MKSGYQYLSSVFNSGATDNQQNGRIIKHTSNCDDCFLGMQVSRREAYVELVLKVSEWFGWLVAVTLFPDPDLAEETSTSEKRLRSQI